jgi:hypothetical protein
MNPFVAALLGLVAGFVVTFFVTVIFSLGTGKSTPAEMPRNISGILWALIATNILLGGILAVLLWQATR